MHNLYILRWADIVKVSAMHVLCELKLQISESSAMVKLLELFQWLPKKYNALEEDSAGSMHKSDDIQLHVWLSKTVEYRAI